MLSFFSASFAVAGLAAALGPILIHLLNRRRFRVVHWAPMEFLLQAAARSRRVLRLRDVLLLFLRTLALALFGLAMARPYLSRSGEAALRDEPVHAVIVLDNSLSMTYEKLNGTVLDEARAKVRDLIARLPEGSWISILPLCGSSSGLSRDAYRTKEDAVEALASIEAVDRQGSAAQAVELARDAASRVEELSSKRVVFVGDQQLINWPRGLEADLQALPDLQVVEAGAPDPENAWVASVFVRDGLADSESPAAITAAIRFEGSSPRAGVPVTLSVNGVQTSTQTVDLVPGQKREVTFYHTFDIPAQAGRPAFALATVSIPPDRLPADDERALCVPVAAGLPVLFVDSVGEDEEPSKGRLGETFRLRRLLAPASAGGPVNGPASKPLARAAHKRTSDLARASLEDARLVVMAGVERPGAAVSLLREYVEQGGSLVITAGEDFDPGAWSAEAWLGGLGILPLPLKPAAVGRLPGSPGEELKPFTIAVDSISSDYFLPAGSPRDELEDLYAAPLIFKAVEADTGDDSLRTLAETVARHAAEDRPDDDRLAWLRWRKDLPSRAAAMSPEEVARRESPRVLARFTNGLPFLIERQIGKGIVVFVSTGVQSEWSTITRTNAVILFDRLFRSLLERTLPERNLDPAEAVVIPIEPADRKASFTLTRPRPTGARAPRGRDAVPEPLFVDALGADAYGLTLRNVTQRGHYTVRATREAEGAGVPGEPLWEVSMAVNGPERESELATITEAALRERAPGAAVRWVSKAEPIPLESARTSGQESWRLLMAASLLVLLAELALGSWTLRSAGRGVSA